jgi:hypothetical protein
MSREERKNEDWNYANDNVKYNLRQQKSLNQILELLDDLEYTKDNLQTIREWIEEDLEDFKIQEIYLRGKCCLNPNYVRTCCICFREGCSRCSWYMTKQPGSDGKDYCNTCIMMKSRPGA